MPEELSIFSEDKAQERATLTFLSLHEETLAMVTPGKPVMVELRINGVEISFISLINKMREEAVKWSYDKAREILEERAEGLSDTLRRLNLVAEVVEEELKRQIRKLIPEALTNEDYR